MSSMVGSQIRQNAAVRQLALVADHNERHGVGGVSGEQG